MQGIYSLAISACATLDLHSLNNEGGEGNQIQTRMVNIVSQDGRLENVNAISGDMWKHIQAEHLLHLAKTDSDCKLCAGCQLLDANRISADSDFIAQMEDKTVSDAKGTDLLLQSCAVDDLEGNLITSGGRSLPRKSVVEFGWVVGRPDTTTTESYFHVKYARERGKEQLKADSEEGARGSNLGQNIFHRPASSGQYAVVANLEAARIGFNDITQRYAIDDDRRRARFRLLLQSVLYTFLQPNGAMRNTQNPHIVGLEGVVSLSRGPMPAPTVSPLRGDYQEQIVAIVQNLAPLHQGSIEVQPFQSLADFTAVMTQLVESESPYSLSY